MDAFIVPAFTNDPAPQPKKPASSFRLIFLLLLLATLASAAATTYILISGVPQFGTASVQQPTAENPFTDSTPTFTNPFTEAETDTASLFSEENTTNFFDQFDTEEVQASEQTYENPF